MGAGQVHSDNPIVDEAVRQPILDRDEEWALARRAEAGDGEALSRLVGSHLRFVIKIARGYRGWGLPMNDLIQEGTLGLIRAVRRFDPDRELRLSTYAVWWIRAAIQEYVLRSWSLVRIGTTNAQKALALKLRRMSADMAEAGEELRDEIATALAEGFGITTTEVTALARRVTARDGSLDQPIGGGSPIDRLASEQPTPEQAVAQISEQRFLCEVIGAALARLPPREQLVIRKRYFEEARTTFDAIGRELGVSKDRVRQLEAHALATLQEQLQPVLADSRS
jgi:RNA polymerase sigma-32 factor